MSFSNLKKRNAASMDKLISAAEAAGAGKSSNDKKGGDDRMWKPTVDKAGNGYAVIRFLPVPDGDDAALPWVRYWDHGFQGAGGKWYIEKSLTTLGQDDPVSESNSVLWNSGREEDKQTARDRKRRLHYVSNILVVSDPSNKDAEGEVFFFQYGKKIFDKIMDAMQPEFADETPINPFDFWGGADFKMKIRQVDGFRNYDKSEFADPAPLFGGDDSRIEEVYNKLRDLSEFTNPANYKSYEELKAKFIKVTGETGYNAAQSASLGSVAEARINTKPRPAPEVHESVDEPEDVAHGSAGVTEDNETLSYFQKLAAKS